VLTRDGHAEVYLPAGNWVDYWSKDIVKGPQWLTVDVALDTLPLWVREGAIIPMGPEMDYVDQKALDPLTVEIYLPGEEGRFLIEDEDKPAIPIEYKREGFQLVVSIGQTAGQVELKVYGEKVISAVVDGKELEVISLENGSQINLNGQIGFEVVLRLEDRE
jgi:alpha-D-xyloside xylohydrolase